ncbi:MAG: hypothetical protein KAJ66_03070 [Candidatus Omnitrophica bacterium]|nr:hypothetical protein [Candidatus Omnitrophota bacterium]
MKLLFRDRILIKFILLSLFTLTIILYLASKEKELLDDFKSYLEIEMRQALLREVKISGISGGIFTPVALQEVKITNSLNNPDTFLFIKRVEVNKRIWDLFFLKKGLRGTLVLKVEDASLFIFGGMGPRIKNQSGVITLDKDKELLSINLANEFYSFTGKAANIYGTPFLDMKLQINSNFVKGEIGIEGNPNLPSITADLNLFGLVSATFNNLVRIDEEKVFFDNLILQGQYFTSGEIDLERGEVEFSVTLDNNEKINISFKSIDNLSYAGLIEVSHLKIKDTDVDVNCEIKVDVSKGADGAVDKIKGELNTSTFIVNYEPFDDISAAFTHTEDSFAIDYLKIGDSFGLRGLVSFDEPETVDMFFELKDFTVENLSRFSFVPDNFNFKSTINVEANVKGEPAKPHVKIHLTSTKGNMNDILFDSIMITLEGNYPILKYRDSRINRGEGYLPMAGKVDFRKIKAGGLFEDTIITSDEETIIWEGWDITKKQYEKEVSLRKSVKEGISVLYRGYLNDETQAADDDHEDTIELEYGILENQSLKMKLKKDEEFFGLENKIRF